MTDLTKQAHTARLDQGLGLLLGEGDPVVEDAGVEEGPGVRGDSLRRHGIQHFCKESEDDDLKETQDKVGCFTTKVQLRLTICSVFCQLGHLQAAAIAAF